jgi:hypothetical protein
MDVAADLGYTGVEGIAIVPLRTPPGGQLHESQAAYNADLSKIRSAVEHAIAHVKTWRMLSEAGGRYRPPLEKFQSTLTAITGLFFFTRLSQFRPPDPGSPPPEAVSPPARSPRAA